MDDRRALAGATIAFLTVAALAPVAVTALVLSSLLFPPPLDKLPDPRPPGGSQLSRVQDANGREIAVFREFDQRLPLQPGDIPQVLKQAVVSVEDKSFYTNNGLDVSGTLRALIANVQGREIVQGGSTITQQYVKNAYVGTERTLERKVKEAVLARQLNRIVDKDEILFNYLDGIYLGEGAIGVGAASQTYFRKPVNELTVSEAALLAGLIPAPSRYEPRGNPDAAEDRRTFVLDTMLDQGYITSDEHAEASRLRVWLTADGPAPRPSTLVYPPTDESANEYPYFVDYVRRYLESQYGEQVYAGGLEIRTTLTPRLQELADRTVDEALQGTTSPIEMALVTLEPQSGFVRAMVGGRDFSESGGQVNLALGNCAMPPEEVRDNVDVAASCWGDDSVVVEGGGTGRQPGSSWKPMVLATALEQGTADSKVYSAPSVYRIPNCTGIGCEVNNYEGSSGGQATLREATVRSYNTVYAQVINEVGVPEVAAMAKKLGISSAWVANPEIHGTSYALGAQEVSPLDMASAYGVFATNGLRNPATPVLWVKDANGEFLEDNRQREPERVLDERVAYNVTDILRGVISGGTGTKADIGRPAAGKTGTAQEWRDAWFVGYTPSLSTAVWIGDKTKPTSLFDIKGVDRVTGGSIPAETWNAFMSQALESIPPTDFEEPPPPPAPPPPPPVVTVPPPPPSDVTTTTLAPAPTFSPPPFRPPSTLTTSTTSAIVPRNRQRGRRDTSTTTTTRQSSTTTTTTTSTGSSPSDQTTTTVTVENG